MCALITDILQSRLNVICSEIAAQINKRYHESQSRASSNHMQSAPALIKLNIVRIN